MKVETHLVIDEIIDLRVNKGYSSPSMVKYLKEKYDLEQSRAYDLIKEAKIKLGEIYNKVNENALEESIIIMENMRQKELQIGNTKLALEIQKELNKINQLYIQKLDITSNGQPIIINIKKEEE